MIGKRIGNYQILEELGEGGIGVVYKGLDATLDRVVAIKVLHEGLSANSDLVARFHAEAKAQARLTHANIAVLYAFEQIGKQCIIVMEFLEGETLEHLVQRRGPVPSQDAVPLFKQALLGIGYAHRHGVIHRDIKPSNIMITPDGLVKVMDFGIARVEGEHRLTQTGTRLGTLAYMSPEQILGQRGDARSDIYSLGITLYQLLAGCVPFQSDTDYQLMTDHLKTPPPPPTNFYPYIPAPIVQAVLKSLAKSVDDRFQSCADFGAALDHNAATESAAGLPVARVQVPPPVQRVVTPPPAQSVSPGPFFPAALFCPQCGAPNPAGAAFCASCRANLPATPPTVGPGPVVVTPPQPLIPAPSVIVPPPVPRRLRARYALIGVAALVLLAIIYFSVSNRSDSSNSSAGGAPSARQADASPSPAASADPQSAAPALIPAPSAGASPQPQEQLAPASSFTGQFGGTATNQTAGKSADIAIIVREDEGALSGCMMIRQPLFGSGPLAGTVTGSGVAFDVTSTALGRISFMGKLQNGVISGTYLVYSPNRSLQQGTITLEKINSNGPAKGFDTSSCLSDAEVNK